MASKSLFAREIDPFVQAAYVFGGSIFFTLLSKFMSSVGIGGYEAHVPWTMSAAALMFFALFNSVFSLSCQNQNRYWFRSIIAYIGLVLLGGMFSYLLSGLSISEAKSFKWIYLLFTFGYLTFLSIVTLMRKIVGIAQKQDRRLRGEE